MSDFRKSVYAFGRFRLDSNKHLLFAGQDIVALTPKAFDTLLALVENGGSVLSKDELMKLVWPHEFVEENNLAQNIHAIRKALGERSDGVKYIETIPKRGYRFVADVATTAPKEPPPAAEHNRDDAVFLPATPSGHRPASFSTNSMSAPINPQTHYAISTGDVNIAYQVIGDGPFDLVFVMGWVSHLEYFWRAPSFARFLMRLASFSRLILFDKRGTGLSDRVPINEMPTLEQRMDDVRAVLDAVNSERAAICEVSEGGPMSALFSATYPEKTMALVMIGTYAKRVRDPEYPWAPTAEHRQQFLADILENWGGPIGLEERAPSVADDHDFREWWATYLRMGASPGAAVALTKMNAEIDVRSVLPTIHVPTLILHRTGDRCLKVEEGRYVAGKIPDAKYVELPGDDHLPFVGDQDALLDEIEEFLTGVRHKWEPNTVLATVLFMHIVDSPRRAAEYGEGHWSDLIERFRAHVRKEIEWFRGREVDMEGTKALATFDGPARAIRCACAIREYAARLGVEVRAGLHTGECDMIGPNKVGGTAVKIGEQIRAQAKPGEVLISSTVKYLVAGSGLRFDDHGDYRLMPDLGVWRLFKVDRGGCS